MTEIQFGGAHPDTLTAMTDLAETLRWTGETDEAASWYGLVFDMKSKTVNKNAPDMISAPSDHANSPLDEVEAIEAQGNMAEVLRENEKMFGHDHLHTFFPMNNLAAACRNEGKLGAAEKTLTTSYNIPDLLSEISVEKTIVMGSNLVSVLFELGAKRQSLDSLTQLQ
ncbi:hypothetical protein K4K57_005125 [Colletotrichum sp. SAR 10_99]|nr:hypothetical protein K4K57_005125 [Colletotrichum sp. SAR 10_99]